MATGKQVTKYRKKHIGEQKCQHAGSVFNYPVAKDLVVDGIMGTHMKITDTELNKAILFNHKSNQHGNI